MKKYIPLWLVLIAEAFLLFGYGFYATIGSPSFLSWLNVSGTFYVKNILGWISSLFNRYGGIKYPGYVSLLIFNALLIIVYVIVANIISFASKKSKEKKMLRVIKEHYKLTEAEEKEFDYHNYIKKFPIKRTLSLIIPLFLIFLAVATRFDNTVVTASSSNLGGWGDLYTNFIAKMWSAIFYASPNANFHYLNLFYNANQTGYIDRMNLLIGNFAWLEYIIIPLASIVFLALWFGFLSLINLMFKSQRAKGRAKKAKEAYIYSKDKEEYKFRLKHGKEYSNKSEEFINMYENEDKTNPIAEIDDQDELKKNATPDEIEYYETLGEGVKDLGIGESSVSTQKAIVEREVRYIADEDFDIVLEAEPVIESVEDDELDALIAQNKEDELFYEKYIADEIAVKPLEDYEKNNDIIPVEDEEIVERYVEQENVLPSLKEDAVVPTKEIEKVVINYDHDPNAAVKILMEGRTKLIASPGNVVLGEKAEEKNLEENKPVEELVEITSKVEPFINYDHDEDAAVNILLEGREKLIASPGNSVFAENLEKVSKVETEAIKEKTTPEINYSHDPDAAVKILLSLSSYREAEQVESEVVEQEVRVESKPYELSEEEKNALRRKAYEDYLNEFRSQGKMLDLKSSMTKEKAQDIYYKMMRQKAAKEKALKAYAAYKHQQEKEKALNVYASFKHEQEKEKAMNAYASYKRSDNISSSMEALTFTQPVNVPKMKTKKVNRKSVTPKKEYSFRQFRPADVRTGKVESRIPTKREQEALKILGNHYKVEDK